MKKEFYNNFMCIISVLLILGFIIQLGIDYFNYDPMYTSAPFYVNIIIRTLEFILPSIILFIIVIVGKKNNK